MADDGSESYGNVPAKGRGVCLAVAVVAVVVVFAVVADFAVLVAVVLNFVSERGVVFFAANFAEVVVVAARNFVFEAVGF